MTKIRIEPISPDAPGSYRLMKDLMAAYARVQANEDDFGAMVDLFDRVEAHLIKFASTDDGTPVAEALAEVSFNDMMDIVEYLLGEDEAVPKETGANSGGG